MAQSDFFSAVVGSGIFNQYCTDNRCDILAEKDAHVQPMHNFLEKDKERKNSSNFFHCPILPFMFITPFFYTS